jgi:hypothetical protein
MHPLLEITLEDIFNKFDISCNGVLGLEELKGFMDCINKTERFEEADFMRNIYSKYQSTKDIPGLQEQGLSLNGFKDFFYDEFIKLTKMTNNYKKAETIVM